MSANDVLTTFYYDFCQAVAISLLEDFKTIPCNSARLRFFLCNNNPTLRPRTIVANTVVWFGFKYLLGYQYYCDKEVVNIAAIQMQHFIHFMHLIYCHAIEGVVQQESFNLCPLYVMRHHFGILKIIAT